MEDKNQKTWTKDEVEIVLNFRKNKTTLIAIAEKLGRSIDSVRAKSARIKKNAKKEMAKDKTILVIGDLHAPFIKSGYLEFCIEMYKKHKCTHVVFTGDILDNHVASYHESDPDGMGGKDELDLAKKQILGFYEAFPFAKVCIGNHDALPNRKAYSNGISASWIRTIDEVLSVPNWSFNEEWIIDKVKYIHGIGMKVRPRVLSEMCSIVQGHLHSETEYVTFVNEKELMFGLQIGCGIERRSYAMAYGRHFKKPQINVGIVTDNGRQALIEHMKLGE